jgi:hypothetical protein
MPSASHSVTMVKKTMDAEVAAIEHVKRLLES